MIEDQKLRKEAQDAASTTWREFPDTRRVSPGIAFYLLDGVLEIAYLLGCLPIDTDKTKMEDYVYRQGEIEGMKRAVVICFDSYNVTNMQSSVSQIVEYAFNLGIEAREEVH